MKTFASAIITVAIIAIGGGFELGYVAAHASVDKKILAERERAVHENAAEYYIDPNTFERKFRYKTPVAAPTPLPHLEPELPPWP